MTCVLYCSGLEKSVSNLFAINYPRKILSDILMDAAVTLLIVVSKYGLLLLVLFLPNNQLE